MEAEAILEAHCESTWERGQQVRGRILVVQDSTSIDYGTHPRTEGLGLLETEHSRGFLVHSAPALTEQGGSLGLLHQARWTRDPGEIGKRNTRRERLWQEKESYKWQRTVEKVGAGQPAEKSFSLSGIGSPTCMGCWLLHGPRG